ncbi:cytoplasmic protein [Marispirochaeta aestuarii]|uniref:cytoplasmic protein n=1 Tax=Marispirochaeta aestuarii TaxID=1963862 RepID=UPI002ABD7A0C|nr:cytoplasmic protein [Marispirochaeta aestuarii]
MEIDYKEIHKKSSSHEQDIKNSKICGCFYCLNIFSPEEIDEWWDEKSGSKTATCPKCGIDAILPDSIGHEITEELLEEMKKKYFF